MNAKTETSSSRFDSLKLVIAAGFLLTAIIGFYYFSAQSLLLRVVGILVAAGIAITIALQTDIGRTFWGFIQESRTEVRKVVWPTRAETVQTTLIVIVMVILAGILLWLLDMFLLWAVEWLTRQGD